jgi:tetratricopeptide (TPR) repeat protein
MNKTFQELLNSYSSNTVDPYSNLELGQYYDNLGQSASALSFYLRAAELTEDPNLAYDCLVRNALLIEKLQRRPH